MPRQKKQPNVNYPGRVEIAMVNTYSKTFEYEDYTSAYLIDVTEAIELFGNRYDEINSKSILSNKQCQLYERC